MAYKPNKELKTFYSIGEVAKMFNINEWVLRSWEKEFSQIKPIQVGAGNRKYRKEDIEAIRIIHHLVREEGRDFDAVRRYLEHNKDSVERRLEVLDRLNGIREELVAIRKELDGIKL
jgi:DNA-binding transcriptional MerR regulator